MAISTATAIIGSAVLGAGTSLYGASKASSASKSAAQAQTQANDQAIQFQREQRDIATQQLTPYQQRGNAAFALMAPHLGMGGGAPSPANGQMQMPASGLGGQNIWSRYLQANPDVAQAAVAALRTPHMRNQGISTPEQFAEYHFNTFGRSEGRQLSDATAPAPQTGLGNDMAEYQTPGQAQEDAWEKYRTETTFGKMGDFYAQKAGKEFMDLAGSQGSALSGRTVRGMAEVGNEAAMGNFNSYMGYLGGISDQGYGATTGIASAGQNFANNASQLTQASGAAAAAGKIGSGSAWQTGLADIAGWGGWAAGQLYKPTSGGGTQGLTKFMPGEIY
jgi:hypothetical protein